MAARTSMKRDIMGSTMVSVPKPTTVEKTAERNTIEAKRTALAMAQFRRLFGVEALYDVPAELRPNETARLSFFQGERGVLELANHPSAAEPS